MLHQSKYNSDEIASDEVASRGNSLIAEWVVRHGLVFLLFWVVVFLLLLRINPLSPEMGGQREAEFFPDNVPSRKAEELFQQAFDKDLLRSLIVISIRRSTRPEGLTSQGDFQEQDRGRKSDYEFIEKDLRPNLVRMLKETRRELDLQPSNPAVLDLLAEAAVATPSDKLFGPLLTSRDKQSSLVIIELPNERLDQHNALLMERIEELLYRNSEFRSIIPPGLEIAMSGTATVRRDVSQATYQSRQAVFRWLLFSGAFFLLLLYRAPCLALIPLLATLLGQQISLRLVAWLAQQQWIQVYDLLGIMMTVSSFALGIAYSQYLIICYRNELELAFDDRVALSRAISMAFPRLFGSLLLLLIPVFLLIFSEHQKYQQAGWGVMISLLVVLLVVITLVPFGLKLLGKWAFWPNVASEQPDTQYGWIPQANFAEKFLGFEWFRSILRQIQGAMIGFPGTTWLICVVLILPLAIFGAANFQHLSYSLLDELPETSRSVAGSRSVQQHFPPGFTGPATILLQNTSENFFHDSQVEKLRKLSDELYSRKDSLGLLDVFSSAYPLGMTPEGRKRQAELETLIKGPAALQAAHRAGMRSRVMKQYVGNQAALGGHVARLDLVFPQDPFQQESIPLLEKSLQEIRQQSQEIFTGTTEVYALGMTASINDLKSITDRDQLRLMLLLIFLLIGIFTAWLRRWDLAVYLVLLFLLSYLASLGMTTLWFWLTQPGDYPGLDWKVRLFLFVFCMGINSAWCFLFLQRVLQEQKKSPRIKGIRLAVSRSSEFVFSSGLMMLVCFGAYLFGSLGGLRQLGFALVFAMLLDTFVLRSVLVPCYLVLSERMKSGKGFPQGGSFLSAGNQPVRSARIGSE